MKNDGTTQVDKIYIFKKIFISQVSDYPYLVAMFCRMARREYGGKRKKRTTFLIPKLFLLCFPSHFFESDENFFTTKLFTHIPLLILRRLSAAFIDRITDGDKFSEGKQRVKGKK
jgi:hypothetical protein